MLFKLLVVPALVLAVAANPEHQHQQRAVGAEKDSSGVTVVTEIGAGGVSTVTASFSIGNGAITVAGQTLTIPTGVSVSVIPSGSSVPGSSPAGTSKGSSSTGTSSSSSASSLQPWSMAVPLIGTVSPVLAGIGFLAVAL